MGEYSSLHATLYDRMNGACLPGKIHQAARGSKYMIKCLEQSARLTGHQGCVNTISWSESGDLLLSGSDDCHLNIYRPSSRKLLKSLKSGHRANIFSAKFLPCTGDRKIVSCAGDGNIQFSDLDREAMTGQFPFNCHSGTTYEVLTTPGDPNTFLTCGEDGTVRLFDLREKSKCVCRDCKEDILIDCTKAVTSISVNPVRPYHLAIGCEDSTVRVFDRRAMSTDARATRTDSARLSGMFCQFRPEALAHRSCRVTSLQYSSGGSELLVSYCADYVYLFSLCDKKQTCPSSESQDKANGYHSNGQRSVPPLKRLRLRGDWSDTGPNARPESEHASPESSLMQRMSEMFTRWLEQSFRDGQRRRQRSASSSLSNSASSVSLSSPSSSPSYFSGSSSSESGGGAFGDELTRTSGRADGQTSLQLPTVTESTSENPSGDLRGSEASHASQRQDRDVSVECSADAQNRSEAVSVGPLESERTRESEVRRPVGENSAGRLSEVKVPMEVDSESSPLLTRLPDVRTSSRASERSPKLSEDSTRTNSESRSVRATSPVTETVITNTREDRRMAEGPPDPPEFQAELNSAACSTLPGRTCVSVEKSHGARELCPSRAVETSGSATCELVSHGSSTNGTTKKPPTSCMTAQVNKNGPSEDEPSNPVLLTGSRSRKRSGNSSSDGHSGREIAVDERSGQAAFGQIASITESRTTGGSSDPVDSVMRDSNMRDGAGVTQRRPNFSSFSSTMRVTNDSEDSASGDSGMVTQRASTSTEDGVETRGEATPCVDTATRRSDDDESDWAERMAAATSIQRLYRRRRIMTARQSCVGSSPEMTRVYKGHRNSRTMIKEANFYGDRYILSGSDCGRIFFWDKHTGEIVMIVQGDRHVVNCVQPHPFYPVIASSGIDYDVKIWEPSAREPADLLDADEIVRRNEKMLEESRDTLTVPASFMIRMLASLNRAMPGRSRDSDSDSSDD